MNKTSLTIGLIAIVVLVGAAYYAMTTKSAMTAADTNKGINTMISTEATGAPSSVVESGSSPTGAMGAETAKGDTMKPQIKEFTISGSNFSFSQTSLSVQKGDTVKITFKNEEGTHDWVVDEFKTRTKILKAGEEETIQFTADTVGTFEYYCSVGQHRQMGMKGTLTVTQ